MLVTWPFVMLLLDYWPLGRFDRLDAPTLDPRLLDAWLTGEDPVLCPRGGGERRDLRGAEARQARWRQVENLPLGARVGNALISYCRYLGKLFWPTDLAVFYPHPGHWPLGKVLLAGGLILGISVLVFVRRRRYPFLLMGWLWFVGTLVPVIGLVQVGGQAMADRYTYLPSLGVLILAIWGAYELTRRWRYQVMALSVAGSAAIVLCLGLTRQQLGYWKDSETLFRHALEVTENNYLAHNNLGVALAQERPNRRGDPPIPGSHPPETGLRRSPLQPRHRPRQERPDRRGDQPIPGSHPPETGLRRRPFNNVWHRPRPERPNRRGDPPIPGSHPPETGLCATPTTTSASPSARKAKPTRRSANSRKPSA